MADISEAKGIASGDFSETKKLYQRALLLRIITLGEKDPSTISCRDHLAKVIEEANMAVIKAEESAKDAPAPRFGL